MTTDCAGSLAAKISATEAAVARTLSAIAALERRRIVLASDSICKLLGEVMRALSTGDLSSNLLTVSDEKREEDLRAAASGHPSRQPWTDAQREQAEITADSGMLRNKLSGGSIKDDQYLFAESSDGRLYIGRRQKHAQILSGLAAGMAGHITIKNGVASDVMCLSGHYKPETDQFLKFVERALNKGIITSATRVYDTKGLLGYAGMLFPKRSSEFHGSSLVKACTPSSSPARFYEKESPKEIAKWVKFSRTP